jgi:hypothetical protein
VVLRGRGVEGELGVLALKRGRVLPVKKSTEDSVEFGLPVPGLEVLVTSWMWHAQLTINLFLR